MESANVKQTVPFLAIASMERSVRFYVDGLGFRMTNEWIHEGARLWCSLARGGGALMLQQIATEGEGAWAPRGVPGAGVTIYFLCADALALYREIAARGVKAGRPFVGNGMWVVEMTDPDGYRLAFESATDVAENTVFDPAKH